MARPKLTRQRKSLNLRDQALGPWTQGVNEKVEPQLLEFSELADARNVLLDERTGRLIKRPGTKFKVSVAELDNPVTGYHNFVKQDGTEIMLLTDSKKLVATFDMETFTDITPVAFLNGGEFAGDPFFLSFATGFDKVWITNGVDPFFGWDGVVAGIPSESLVAYDKETGEVTLSGGDGGTQISDPLLDRGGDGTTWVGQLLVVTQASDQSLIGVTRPIKTFDDGTDTVTFDSISGLSVNDKVKIGVAIPRGRYATHHFNTIFVATTPENQSEIRFNDGVDPNEPGIIINPDNPNAWPANRQIQIDGGDRIWGFSSPVYRDRFCVMKSSGLYRIEPDPTFLFVPVAITTQFGSRFPMTWQQHGNVLMFLGQDKDGKPDILMTDFVSVQTFKRKHSLTLDSLQQPNSVFRSKIINSRGEFDAGSKSSFIDTNSSVLRLASKNSLSDFQSILESGSNVDMESTPGEISVIGRPASWSNRYEADQVPEAEGWQFVIDKIVCPDPGAGHSVAGGILNIDSNSRTCIPGGGIGLPVNGVINKLWYRPGVFTTNDDALISIRARTSGAPGDTNFSFALGNGQKGVYINLIHRVSLPDQIQINDSTIDLDVSASFHEYTVILKKNGNFKIWRDGVKISDGQGFTATVNGPLFGVSFMNADVLLGLPGGDNQLANAEVDRVYYHGAYKGDSLDSQGGKISPTSIPDNIPTSGSVEFTNDYGKDIHDNPLVHSIGRTHFDVNSEGGGSVDSDARTSEDNVVFPDAFSPIISGTVPPLPVRRFFRYRFTLNNVISSGLSSKLTRLASGGIYLTDIIPISSQIKAWDIQQIASSLAPGASFNVKIRRATAASLGVLTEPSKLDQVGWLIDTGGLNGNPTDVEGWSLIQDGLNIGNIFGGVEDAPNPPDPEAVFIQLKVEMDLAAIDDENTISSMISNWREGTAIALPTSSIMFNKRYLLTSAEESSASNNIVVTVDKERSFSNWGGMNVNCFAWYRGKLFAFDSNSQDAVEVVEGLYSDDDGDNGAGGRNAKAIQAYVETRVDIGGAIHLRKRARYLECLSAPIDGTIDFKIKRETDQAFQDLNSVVFSPSVDHKRLHFPVGYSYRRIQIRAENNNLNEDFSLNGCILSYQLQPGRSNT